MATSWDTMNRIHPHTKSLHCLLAVASALCVVYVLTANPAQAPCQSADPASFQHRAGPRSTRVQPAY